MGSRSPHTGARVGEWLAAGAVMLTSLGLVIAAERHRTVGSADAGPEPAYASGNMFTEVPGPTLTEGKRHVFVVVRSTCAACVASRAFYQSLASLQVPAVFRLHIVGLIADQGLETYAAAIAGVDVVRVLRTSSRLRTVPAVIVVDQHGLISNIWEGRLIPEREAEVMTALQAPVASRIPVESWHASGHTER